MCFVKGDQKNFYQFESLTNCHLIKIPESIIETYVEQNPGVMNASGGWRS